MSIFDKIFRGTVANDKKGDPLREGGKIINDNFDIAEAALLDRLLRVDSVENIAGFSGDYDGQQISLLGWHPDIYIGGGVLYWDSTKAKSDHNGGTVFSPTVPLSANIGDYLDGVGETDGLGFGCWVRKSSEVIRTSFFGYAASINDHTKIVQYSIMATKTELVFTKGYYYLSKNKGINDKWGVYFPNSNITITAENGVYLRRIDSDISTYSKSFPLFFIGTPDSEVSPVDNIDVSGFTFIGENTQHSINGSAISDGRQAIWLKNASNCSIERNIFTNIDSGAILAQSPAIYNYEDNLAYNTTKCSNIEIRFNDFKAVEHSSSGRARLHAINVKSDSVSIYKNKFSWCDVCVSSSGTYDDYSDKATDTYFNSTLGTNVLRTGKGLDVSGNEIYNSSEHSIYIESMSFKVQGNIITIDDPTVCNTNQIQVRGRGGVINDNILTGVYAGSSITTGAMDVLFHDNLINAVGDSSGGVINIQSQGLTAFINARSEYYQSYKPMQNITVKGNTINLIESAQTNGVGVRVYTDDVDSNYPDGQMIGVQVCNNIIGNAKKGMLFISAMLSLCSVRGNSFQGKPFNKSGFNSGTTLNSEAVISVNPSSAVLGSLKEVTFDDNRVAGFSNILKEDGGSPSNDTILLPNGVRGNSFRYIKEWSSLAFKKPNFQTMFTANVGQFFLDRDRWYSFSVFNNSIGNGASSNTENKSMILTVSNTDVRLYTDDAGTFKAL